MSLHTQNRTAGAYGPTGLAAEAEAQNANRAAHLASPPPSSLSPSVLVASNHAPEGNGCAPSPLAPSSTTEPGSANTPAHPVHETKLSRPAYTRHLFYRLGKHAAAHALTYLLASIVGMFLLTYPALHALLVQQRLQQLDQGRFWQAPMLPRTVTDQLHERTGSDGVLHIQQVFVRHVDRSRKADALRGPIWALAQQLVPALERTVAGSASDAMEVVAKTVTLVARGKADAPALSTQLLQNDTVDNSGYCLAPGSGRPRCFVMSPWTSWSTMDTHASSPAATVAPFLRADARREWTQLVHRLSWPSTDAQLSTGSISGVLYDWRHGRVRGADAVVLSYFWLGSAGTRESALPETTVIMPGSDAVPGVRRLTVQLANEPAQRMNVQVDRGLYDMPIAWIPIILALVIVFFSASHSLGSVELVKSQHGIGFAAVLTVVFSMTMSYGASAILGIVYEAVPGQEIYITLLMAVCIENMFVVTNAVVSTSMDLPVSERVGRGLRAVAVPLMLGLLLQLLMLLGGYLLGDSVLRKFCILGMFTVCFSFVQQLVFLVPILCIDIRRLELSDLHDRRVVHQIRRFPPSPHASTNGHYMPAGHAPHNGGGAHARESDLGESRVQVFGISVLQHHTLSIFCVAASIVCVSIFYPATTAQMPVVGQRSYSFWQQPIATYLPWPLQAPPSHETAFDLQLEPAVAVLVELDTTKYDQTPGRESTNALPAGASWYATFMDGWGRSSSEATLVDQSMHVDRDSDADKDDDDDDDDDDEDYGDQDEEDGEEDKSTGRWTLPSFSGVSSTAMIVKLSLWLVAAWYILQTTRFLRQLAVRHRWRWLSQWTQRGRRQQHRRRQSRDHTNAARAIGLRRSTSLSPVRIEWLTGRSAHENEVNQLDVNAYGTVVSACVDGHVQLWRSDCIDPVLLTASPGDFDGLGVADDLLCVCVLADPDDAWVAAGYEDGSVRVWRVSDARLLHLLADDGGLGPGTDPSNPGAKSSPMPMAEAFALLLDPATQSHLIVVHRDGMLRRWNLVTGVCEQVWHHTPVQDRANDALRQPMPRRCWLTAVYVSSAGDHLFTADATGVVMAWQLTMNMRSPLSSSLSSAPSSPSLSRHFMHMSSLTLATGSTVPHDIDDEDVVCAYVVEMPSPVLSLTSCCSQHCQLMLAGCADGTVHIWQASDGQRLLSLEPGASEAAPVTRLWISRLPGPRAGDLSIAVTAVRTGLAATVWRVEHADTCQCEVHRNVHAWRARGDSKTGAAQSSKDRPSLLLEPQPQPQPPELTAVHMASEPLLAGQAGFFAGPAELVSVRKADTAGNRYRSISDWELSIATLDRCLPSGMDSLQATVSQTHGTAHERPRVESAHDVAAQAINAPRLHTVETIPLALDADDNSYNRGNTPTANGRHSNRSTFSWWHTTSARFFGTSNMRWRTRTTAAPGSSVMSAQSRQQQQQQQDTRDGIELLQWQSAPDAASALPFSRIHCMVTVEPFVVLACGNRILRLLVTRHQMYSRAMTNEHEDERHDSRPIRSFLDHNTSEADDCSEERIEESDDEKEPCKVG
ncbi:hypothetical protein THASP1DRAFT_29165 [Thamnocephalis sphaerospora]|uniref:Sterol regulatory element-binding protein cleavage-activating protein n=1 Tax=Thamnocephalis sphaerospora TaxID=78915 RepID=A0A4P9XSF2_9FUNG|nr:hypothetical protein THASP1DRAFT_29165 [Thamnocephalis sphaerospora]|eukprot:RKP09036.1 hypothetical protein THASP1DRAFT_29165 [Thamnocephalis sphaerospora]